MRVPLEWLSEYVPFSLTTDELAARLTMTGLNVEGVDRPADSWHDVIVGKVVSLEPHPNSRNPLNVALVDVGSRTITIVTAAPNVRAGDIVPVVLVGGRLPHGPDGAPITIEAKPMAGITSDGMLGSARELGISDDHSGIYILPPDTPFGIPLASVMGGDILDIETVSNRPDTLSMIGIAREVAAITGEQLVLPNEVSIEANVEWVDAPSTSLEIAVPDLCPRFTALRIEGVRATPSPAWLVARLQAAGQRPINLLVDLTNYVMLEYGQPMHAFDADRLHTDRIVVRRARDGELIRTLDGVDRVLSPEVVVVADGDRAVSVAGVIGGEESEITDATGTLLLEAATWNAPNIRFTAKALGVRTEASSRFEKGQQPETTMPAVMRYLQLLSRLSDGPLRAYLVADAVERPAQRCVVSTSLRDLERLIGIPVSPDVAVGALRSLGFEASREGSRISAAVPYWRRVDIEQSADLVEEVARLVGFENLPATLPRRTMPPPAPDAKRLSEGRIRDRLLGGGISEITTHSLTSYTSQDRLLAAVRDDDSPEPRGRELVVLNPAGVRIHGADEVPVTLQNPATTEREILRMSLLPSVLDVLARNQKHAEERLAFFEIDRTFFRRPSGLPYERETLAIALSGRKRVRSWADAQPSPYTFFDLKGVVEAVLHAAGVAGWEVVPSSNPAVHPGRSGTIRVDGNEIALLGELHPDVAAAFELETWPVMVAEVDLDAAGELSSTDRSFKALPRYPAAYRDLAAVVPRALPASEFLSLVRREGGSVLESVDVFDVYEGEQIASDKKSMAVGLVFRSYSATLTQDEVSAIMDRIVDAIERELGGTLRE